MGVDNINTEEYRQWNQMGKGRDMGTPANKKKPTGQ